MKRESVHNVGSKKNENEKGPPLPWKKITWTVLRLAVTLTQRKDRLAIAIHSLKDSCVTIVILIQVLV